MQRKPLMLQDQICAVILSDSLEIPRLHQAPPRHQTQTHGALHCSNLGSTRTGTMDPHHTTLYSQDYSSDYSQDYSQDYSPDDREKPSTEERLDSGIDSIQEQDYAALAAEIRGLRLQTESKQAVTREPPHWASQITEDGDTWLHLAIIHEANDYINQIIEQSKNTDFLDAQNDQRQTPLHLAVITNQASVCERLLVAGCDPTLVDCNGDTPLHIACRHGNLPCFSVITQNCLPNRLSAAMAAYNYHGQNCLHLASVQGFLSLVENLVDLGADIDAKEQRSGRGALHLAVDHQNLLLVQTLLRKGADPNLLTSAGHTPFHLTYGRDNEPIRQELFPLTRPGLRDLPDSEDDESEVEEDDEDEDEEVGYDDIQWNGH